MHIAGMKCANRRASLVTSQANMTFSKFDSIKATEDVVSGILNWICPECGGRMGGPGREFRCQGECQKDWRLIWERLSAVRRPPHLGAGPERLEASPVLFE